MSNFKKLLCASLLFFTFQAEAQLVSLPVNPRKTWMVLETEHFEIIYDKSQRKLAEKFAAEAERAEKLLQPLLQIPMSRKVPISIADITDSSNGSATGIPRSQIEIFPVLPSVNDPTSEYYDWTREVVTHEYTHILNFEPTSGFMSVLRFLFGSIIKTGQYQPRWFAEGLAVEMESRLTPVGRGRSHYYTALNRAFFEDPKWERETIDRIGSTDIPTWPRGQRPYTFGYFLMHDLDQQPNKSGSKENIYGVLNNRYGGRFPWFLNGPVEDYFDMDYEGLLDKTYNKLQSKAAEQLKILKNSGSFSGTPLAQEGHFNFGPQISPDKLKLAAIVSQVDDDPSIRIWTRKSPQEPFTAVKDIPQVLTSDKGLHQVSWRGDSKTLVFDKTGVWKTFSTFNDLYEINVETGKEKRLTEGQRAREATVMPDESLVFVQATATKTQLMAADKDGKKIRVIYSPLEGERVSTPRPFQDGIIYSRRDNKGREWIEALSLTTRKARILTQIEGVGTFHTTPVADPKNKNVFYYSSSTSGVVNIYSQEDRPGAQPIPQTNVSTYATGPEVDATAGQILYSRLTSQGFQIETQKQQPLPKLDKLNIIPEHGQADPTEAPPAKIVDQYNYHGVSYLLPQYWIPFVYFEPGGALFSASTSGSDPLNHHQYSLSASYDTRAKQPTEEFLYTNGSLPFFIDAIFSNAYVYLVGLNSVEHVMQAQIDTKHPIFSDSNKWFIGPLVEYKMTDYPGFLFTEVGPGAQLSYNNVSLAKDYQISPESGEAFTIGYSYYLPQWGNTSYQNIRGTASTYLSGWILPKHNVIALKVAAWISPPQRTILTGTQQAGGDFGASLIPSPFTVRGYPVGEFIGSTLLVGSFEYRFPLAYTYSGPGTFPFFGEKLHAALLLDAITLDGSYYDYQSDPIVRYPTNLGVYYLGTGGELRADTTLFYAFPLTFKLGVYYSLNNKAYNGMSYILGIGGNL